MTVYLARAGEDGPVKIGTARDVPRRLATLGRASPLPLLLLRTVEGARAVEQWFHRRFAAQRMHGEWFRYCADMLTITAPALTEPALRDFPIIGRLGGREKVAAELARLGHKIGVDAIRMWQARGTIPGDAVPLLMHIAEAKGVKYAASDFALADGSEADPRPKRRRRRAA